MRQQHALLGAILSAIIVAAIYLFEFAGVMDTRAGGPQQALGQIVRCTGVEGGDAVIKWKREPIVLYLDSTGDKPLRFRRPVQAKKAVLALCQHRAHVAVDYQMYKPPLRDTPTYTLLGMEDLTNNTVVFTPGQYGAWKKTNRLFAIGLMVFFFAGGVYCIWVVNRVVEANTVADEIRVLRGGWWKGQFMIRSTERRPEAWIYLVWFAALTAVLGYQYPFKQGVHWLLLPIGIFAVAGYAYLVEVVNINRLWFQDGELRYGTGPLPWLRRSSRVRVDDISRILARDERHVSMHGPYNLSSVAVELIDGETVDLFYAPSFEHAQAVARLTNGHLEDLRRGQ